MDGMIRAERLKSMVLSSLDAMKASRVVVMDVGEKTTITDFIVVATGSSSRHTLAIARRLAEDVKKMGAPILGIESFDTPDWILVDAGDVVVHVMQQAARDFYSLEKIWQAD